MAALRFDHGSPGSWVQKSYCFGSHLPPGPALSPMSAGGGARGPGQGIAGSQDEGTVSVVQAPRELPQELGGLGKRKLRGAEERPGWWQVSTGVCRCTECRRTGQAPGTAPLPSEGRRCSLGPPAAQQGFQEASGQGPALPFWAGGGGGRCQPQMTRSPPLAPGQLIAFLCSDAAGL